MRAQRPAPEAAIVRPDQVRTWVIHPPLDADGVQAPASRWPAIVVIGVYVAVSIAYGVMSEAPWDDDCVTRYFNTLRAWSDPSQFFSMWNRPLFMFLFAPTAWMGRTAMMVEMVAIGALAGWWLYLTMEKLGAKRAWMVLPLFYFQTFYFTVSRNFLTEPLAVAVICGGLLALVHRRFGWFALAGGLLPLARLELAAALPLWALVLILHRQWRPLLWLGVPALLLALGGALVKPDAGPLWLVDETIGREGSNRYGHRDLWHYFKRYAYVVGPVVFYFLAIGLLERLARWRTDVMVVLQALWMFGLYVLFSWKLDVGNAAGFLRNLIPLTPLVAILAHDGVQAWLLAMARPEGALRPIPTMPAMVEEEPVGRRAKGKPRTAPSPGKAKQSWAWWPTVRVHFFSLATVMVIYMFYSVVLENHHKLTKRTDLMNPMLAAVPAALLVIGTLVYFRRQLPAAVRTGSMIVAGMLALGFTLHRERPDAHYGPERKGITELSKLYKDSYLRQYPLYANHPWFFWPDDLGYPGANYHTLTRQAIESAPPHAVFLWENHYSHRLAGDVPDHWIKRRKDLVLLAELVTSDNRLNAMIFQKVDPEANDAALVRSMFLKQHPGSLPGYHARARYLNDIGNYAGSLVAADTMMLLDSMNLQSHLMRAQALYQLQRPQEAIVQYQRILQLDTAYYMAYYNMGSCYMRAGSPATAIEYYERTLKRAPKVYQAHEGIASAHYSMKRYEQAVEAYTRAMHVKPGIASHYFNRGNCYYQSGALEKALADYDIALARDPKMATAMGNKGLTLLRLKRTAEACEVLKQAKTIGFQGGDAALRAYCGGG